MSPGGPGWGWGRDRARRGPPALGLAGGLAPGLAGGIALALGCATLACSSLADTPAQEECRSDAECGDGHVCAVDQGRCLPGNEAAPRAHLGFDIRERAASVVRFRVEVDGCDCTIDEEENIRELALRRSRVSQLFSLAVTGEVTGPDVPPDRLVPARFELTQPSRYGLIPSPQTSGLISHPTYAEETQAVVETVLRWPRYHPLDVDVPPELVLWKMEPSAIPDGQTPAARYLGIIPPRTDANAPCVVDSDCCEPKGDCNPAPNFCDTEVGECTAVGQPEWVYRYDYTDSCSRAFEGDVVRLGGGAPGSALSGATVSLRYADGSTERFGIPVLGEGQPADRPPQCDDDDDCDAPNQYCDLPSKQCFVALADRSAANASTDVGGTFRTQVYTYCEGHDPSVPLERRYELTVQPTGPRPSVEYLVDAAFYPFSQGDSSFRLANDLCVPDWGGDVGASLEVAVAGPPRTLVTGEGEYTCCDVGCLPSSAEDAEDGPPPVPTACDGRTSAGSASTIRFESFVLEAQHEWEDFDCIEPLPDALGRVGSLVRTATCTTTPGAPCQVDDLALGTTEEPRRYEVRVESEVGSVLASGDFVVELGPEAPARQTLTLAPRVLVTGVVDVDEAICARRDPGEDCAAREAVVLAERLRMPGEAEASVPGPYLHAVSTFHDPVARRDGAFVLPLDPGGVYVVTALPPAGAEGGPAGYTLVDLRSGASDPLQPVRLVLEDGVVVTLRLDQFDPRTTVTPMDRGSYLVPGRTLQLEPGAAPIDLNEIGACLTDSALAQGCQIRRLTPPGADLARSQVGVVRFTARRSDQAECPNRCPMSPPSE